MDTVNKSLSGVNQAEASSTRARVDHTLEGLYCLYDRKAQVHRKDTFFLASTDGIAVRQIRTVLSNPQTEFAQYPEDFALKKLGQWDERSGFFTADVGPQDVIEVRALVEKE